MKHEHMTIDPESSHNSMNIFKSSLINIVQNRNKVITIAKALFGNLKFISNALNLKYYDISAPPMNVS